VGWSVEDTGVTDAVSLSRNEHGDDLVHGVREQARVRPVPTTDDQVLCRKNRRRLTYKHSEPRRASAVRVIHTSITSEREKAMSTQKVAVITGASQGIGAALVTAYRKLGYAVVANSRSITPSDDPMVRTAAGDIADPAVAARVIEQGLDAFGRVDTLINNAGVFVAKPFTDYTDEDYDLVTGVNLRGFFEASKRAIAAMLTQGGGHVVNISTSLVDHANSNVPSALASLTKGGLNAVTRSLAIEYASRGIRVNAVAPGIIRTPMHPAETHEILAGLHPIGRMGEISDIVDAIIYLETATFVTGEILHVDGGQSAGH
jgi:NAD(P)-dependent dehydrogenase (short-subunit alcohol dehydrogenase family)